MAPNSSTPVPVTTTRPMKTLASGFRSFQDCGDPANSLPINYALILLTPGKKNFEPLRNNNSLTQGQRFARDGGNFRNRWLSTAFNSRARRGKIPVVGLIRG